MGEHTEIRKRRAPTLYFIIVIKLLKGLLFVALAVMIYCMSDNDLPAEYRHWLHVLRLNPEREFWTALAKQVALLNENNVLMAAAGTFCYSLFSLVEGVGLLLRIPWAGWMSIGESAFFIPIEIYELLRRGKSETTRHPQMLLVILGINILILVYLLKNKERLFRHHH
ncbi:MAG TPA: DUF2127 domain-containing protein [Verrucomicrobiae bacterium]|nr:DUF2127 domain-containing protein [Verrucomicrobiae bacterium]